MLAWFVATLLLLRVSVFNIAAEQDSRPLFRFGLLADVQYADKTNSGARFYRDSAEKLRDAMAGFNREKPDWIINLGDLIDGHGDRSLAELRSMLELFKASPCAVYHVIGNHCLEVERSQLMLELGLKASYYSFSRPGWRLVVLDTMEISVKSPDGSPERLAADVYLRKNPRLPRYNGAVSDVQLAWLRGQLADAAPMNQWVIVISHHPLSPASSSESLTPWNWPAIVEPLEKSGRVATCFSGHDHRGGYAHTNGIHYVTLPGMVESGPGRNCYAVVEAFLDRLKLRGFGTLPSRELPCREQSR